MTLLLCTYQNSYWAMLFQYSIYTNSNGYFKKTCINVGDEKIETFGIKRWYIRLNAYTISILKQTDVNVIYLKYNKNYRIA